MNKKMQTAVAVVAGLVVVAGAFYFYQGEVQAPFTQSAYNWTFRELPEQDYIPYTEVSLNGRVVGTYQGSCSEVAPQDLNQDSAVLCWFAGGGDEIGVFNGNVVMQGEVQEPSGEGEGFRGNFRTLFAL